MSHASKGPGSANHGRATFSLFWRRGRGEGDEERARERERTGAVERLALIGSCWTRRWSLQRCDRLVMPSRCGSMSCTLQGGNLTCRRGRGRRRGLGCSTVQYHALSFTSTSPLLSSPLPAPAFCTQATAAAAAAPATSQQASPTILQSPVPHPIPSHAMPCHPIPRSWDNTRTEPLPSSTSARQNEAATLFLILEISLCPECTVPTVH